jgi:hypothetical protein
MEQIMTSSGFVRVTVPFRVARGGWRVPCVVAATALLYTLSPVRATGSSLPERTARSNEIHIGAATAADFRGDAQQQARELLTGTTTAHSPAQSPPRDGKLTRPTADAQELARQLLLGTTGSRVGGAEAINHSEVAGASGEAAQQARPVAHGDAQAAARELLLGRTVASDASRLTARRTR